MFWLFLLSLMFGAVVGYAITDELAGALFVSGWVTFAVAIVYVALRRLKRGAK